MKNFVLTLAGLVMPMLYLDLLAQCSVTSSNGYTVTFNLTQQNVLLTPAGPSCNYNVVLNYNIVYSGPNQQNLWSVNGATDCIPAPNLGFNIPTAGSGTTSTYTSTFNNDCSLLNLDCDIKLVVLGPGIPTQTLTGCGQIIYPEPASAPLPVELVSFVAKPYDDHIALVWKTASELNNKGFEIQHSINGKDWETTGWADGAGTTTEPRSYGFNFYPPQGGKTYYFRLKQVDQNGAFEYSEVKNADFFGSTSEILVRPNPVNGQLHFEEKNSGDFLTVQFVNQFGQLVLTEAFSNSLDVSGLPNGVYTAIFQGENNRSTERIIVQH